MREKDEITTLRERRIAHCDKFALKCANSYRFGHWFPEESSQRRGRKTETYQEEYARCDRLFNSPIYYMRRRLNGKEGKKYSSRNKEYRE